MALIRGGKSLFPCPICLVPHDKLVDISCPWPKRSKEDTEMLVENAANHQKAADAAEELKNHGLRPIRVEFLLYYMLIQMIYSSSIRTRFGILIFLIHLRRCRGITCITMLTASVENISGR
jgi:hypothetical protein